MLMKINIIFIKTNIILLKIKIIFMKTNIILIKTNKTFTQTIIIFMKTNPWYNLFTLNNSILIPPSHTKKLILSVKTTPQSKPFSPSSLNKEKFNCTENEICKQSWESAGFGRFSAYIQGD